MPNTYTTYGTAAQAAGATTYTALEVLLFVGDEIGEEAVRAGWVDNVSSTTVRIGGISLGAGVNLQYGLAQVEGKGIRSISTYYEADETIIVASAFSPVAAAGDVLGVYWWDAQKRKQAERAINQAILASYPAWYREVVLELNNTTNSVGATITADEFDSSVMTYDLPSDCTRLLRVGAQYNASDEPVWYAPLDLWRQQGQPGAAEVRMSQRFVDENSSATICYHYEAREPVFSTFTSSNTTQLPLEYFTLAAETYRRRTLKGENAANAQWLAQEAQKTLMRLGSIKPRLSRGPKTGFM